MTSVGFEFKHAERGQPFQKCFLLEFSTRHTNRITTWFSGSQVFVRSENIPVNVTPF